MEDEPEILDHEVFPRCLWTARTAFMVAACGNHVAYTGDGVEHSSHFIVVESLFADSGHRYLEDALDASVEEHFEFI